MAHRALLIFIAYSLFACLFPHFTCRALARRFARGHLLPLGCFRFPAGLASQNLIPPSFQLANSLDLRA